MKCYIIFHGLVENVFQKDRSDFYVVSFPSTYYLYKKYEFVGNSFSSVQLGLTRTFGANCYSTRLSWAHTHHLSTVVV